MTTLNAYLFFKGNCEDAFHFYKSVFGGDFMSFNRYKDAPQTDRQMFPQDADEKIMHVSLPIGTETILMGCDDVMSPEQNNAPRNGFSLSLNTDAQEEADRLFHELSAEGQIKMPMSNTFWGAYFGMLTDKFGINWMVSVDAKKE